MRNDIKVSTEITFDEFADEEFIEAHDEWIDRHGVDRSPDAEGKRIDDAYEKFKEMQDDLIAIADRETVAKHLGKINSAPGMTNAFQPDVSGVWKIVAGTEVFVSDKSGQLRGHRMKKDAVYAVPQIVVPDGSQYPMRFVYPMTIAQPNNTRLTTSLAYLVSEGWVVVETGLKRWPYIIVKQTATIIVYESAELIVGKSGGTCRKLGY